MTDEPAKKAKMPKMVARICEEAAALSAQHLHEYEEWLVEAYPNEFELARPSPEIIRIFALARYKMKKSLEKLREAQGLEKAHKHRQSLEALAEGMRLSAESTFAHNMASNEMAIEHKLWRYGALDTCMMRKPGVLVSSRIDSSLVNGDGSGYDSEEDEDLHSVDPDDPTENGSEPSSEDAAPPTKH